MERCPLALVLTWDSTNVRVKCPYSCSHEIHWHGYTLPQRGRPNTRVAHCPPSYDDHGRPSHKEYALIFPFEEVELTQGMWWILDREACRWRTICWNLHDPEYDKRNEDTSKAASDRTEAFVQTPAKQPAKQSLGLGLIQDVESAEIRETADELSAAFSGLALKSSERKIWFDSFCVLNEVSQARALLAHSNDVTALIEETAILSDGPILVSTCEEGHLEMVNVLLEHGASLEATDSNGNTALHRAIHYGRGTVAHRLIEVGAKTDAVDDEGRTVLDAARLALGEQLKLASSDRKTLDVPIERVQDMEQSTATRRLRKREEEVIALKCIVERCELLEMKARMATALQKITVVHGSAQAKHVEENSTLDAGLIISRIQRAILRTPRGSEWKTIACLTRGAALPYVFAVSGYDAGVFELSGEWPGNRSEWMPRVFQLAGILGHTLHAHDHDAKGQPGSYFACHSEKQLLAYLIWSHTTILGVQKHDIPRAVRESEPSSLSNLEVNIYVSQPGTGKAHICDDCTRFCHAVVKRCGFSLIVRGVDQSRSWVLKRWSSSQTAPTSYSSADPAPEARKARSRLSHHGESSAVTMDTVPSAVGSSGILVLEVIEPPEPKKT